MEHLLIIPKHRDSGTQSVVLCPTDREWHHAHTSPVTGARFCGKCLAEGK